MPRKDENTRNQAVENDDDPTATPEVDPVRDRDRGLHRHGEPDPSIWERADTVTDAPGAAEVPGNSTFGTRKQVRSSSAEDKSVRGSEAKGDRDR